VAQVLASFSPFLPYDRRSLLKTTEGPWFVLVELLDDRLAGLN
jgi:hypothetical protein